MASRSPENCTRNLSRYTTQAFRNAPPGLRFGPPITRLHVDLPAGPCWQNNGAVIKPFHARYRYAVDFVSHPNAPAVGSAFRLLSLKSVTSKVLIGEVEGLIIGQVGDDQLEAVQFQFKVVDALAQLTNFFHPLA